MTRITPLVIVVGETASGKTRLAIDIANALNGEIINADSWAVRKNLNIGTAKPTPEEQEEVAHHLIDIVEPGEDFNAMKFKELANKAIEDIYGRGHLPIIVGGTGLYVDSLIYDYKFLPNKVEVDRKAYESKTVEELLDIIKSKNLDFNGVDLRNKRRLIRLIETDGIKPIRSTMRENTILVGIKWPPDLLKKRIEQRVDQMLEAGLENEVRELSKHFEWDDEMLKGVGYKQWQLYFEGGQTLEETRNQIVSATVGLAKKQRTWFKRNNSIHWLEPSVNLKDVVELITTSLDI